MRRHEDLADGGLHVVAAQVLVRQLLRRDLEQRVAGPLGKPVDGGAVDEARKHAAALAERLAHRRHAQHNVQVGAHTLQEECKQLVLRLASARGLGSVAHLRARQGRREGGRERAGKEAGEVAQGRAGEGARALCLSSGSGGGTFAASLASRLASRRRLLAGAAC
eukprot:363771-Chlamydomonas_euryale.AAC.22